jgi:hypothetical protein
MPTPGNSVLKLLGNPRWLVLLGIGAIGWAAGGGLHRWLGPAPSAPPAAAGVERAATTTRPDPAEAAATRAALDEVAKLKSTDTLDDLLALGDRELYGRLALWVLDASTADLARFRTAYQAKRQPEMWVTDLLFARWTQLDPDDALRAAGKDRQNIVWWAWAINDPATAVARVAGLGPDLMGSVLRAIGQFHPELLDKVMAAHPEFVTGGAIEGVAKGLFREDPETALEFLRQHRQLFYDTKLLREWAQDDPKAAFAWMQKQLGGYQATSQLTTLIDTLERENPAMLRELASEQPPGKLRRQMDAAIFRNLLDTDPAAALAQARAIESPRLAAERLADAARRMVAKDPEQSYALFTELLEKCPTALNHQDWTRYPNGGTGNNGPLEGVRELTEEMLGNDPRRLMAALDAGVPELMKHAWEYDGPAAAVAAQWAQRDLEGFTGWLDELQPGEAQNSGTAIVVGQLTQRQAFQEAAQRAAKVADDSLRNNLVSTVAQSWVRQDRAAAVAWLEQIELPDEVRQRIGRSIGLESREGQP